MNDRPSRFSFSVRVRSMRYAFAGVRDVLATQHNAWIHAAATCLVVCAGALLGVSRIEWCMLTLAMSLVWVAEALNTALEVLCDVVSPEFNSLIGRSKDIAAGAVLLSAAGSVAIALLIFVPYLRPLM